VPLLPARRILGGSVPPKKGSGKAVDASALPTTLRNRSRSKPIGLCGVVRRGPTTFWSSSVHNLLVGESEYRVCNGGHRTHLIRVPINPGLQGTSSCSLQRTLPPSRPSLPLPSPSTSSTPVRPHRLCLLLSSPCVLCLHMGCYDRLDPIDPVLLELRACCVSRDASQMMIMGFGPQGVLVALVAGPRLDHAVAAMSNRVARRGLATCLSGCARLSWLLELHADMPCSLPRPLRCLIFVLLLPVAAPLDHRPSFCVVSSCACRR